MIRKNTENHDFQGMVSRDGKRAGGNTFKDGKTKIYRNGSESDLHSFCLKSVRPHECQKL